MHEWFMSREADPTILLVQHGVDHHRPEKNGKDEPDPGPLNQAG